MIPGTWRCRPGPRTGRLPVCLLLGWRRLTQISHRQPVCMRKLRNVKSSASCNLKIWDSPVPESWKDGVIIAQDQAEGRSPEWNATNYHLISSFGLARSRRANPNEEIRGIHRSHHPRLRPRGGLALGYYQFAPGRGSEGGRVRAPELKQN